MFTRKATKAEVRPSVAFSESDIEQAEKMFNDPNNSEHQFMLGCLLIKSQQEEKLNRAVQIFGTLRDHPSYKRESLYYTALAHSKMGEVFDAKVFVTRLLKMDRDHKSAKVLLDEVDSKIHQMRVERKSLLESSNQKNKFNLFKSTAETDEISDFKRLKVRKTEFYDESPVRSGSIFLTNSFFDEDELIKRIPADQVSQLVESFYSLDMFSRKSNTIDREQFCNALGILGLEASFFIHKYLFKGFSAIERRFGASALADVRRVTIFKEGQEITLNTYLCGMAILLYGTEEEQANFSFGMFDTEDKDYLVEDDIYYALQAICEQLAVMGLEIPPLEETTTAIFTLLDFAGTGHVTRDQFKENLKQNRHLISSLCLFDKFELLMPDCTARGNHSLFATEEWDYALGLMIGLRMSQDMYKPMIREPLMEDFGLEVTFKIPNFKPKKSDEESDNKFVEFAPRVFQKLRDKAGISEAEFMYSLGPEQLLGNLLFGRLASLRVQDSEGSGGRSGASFLFSHDGKFIVKNISAQEFENFKRTLPEYYNYLNQNPNSLITRVYACFIFDGRGFIIMKNVFSTHRRVDEIYDLKGSTVARSSPDGPVYKDMDLTQKIFLGKPKRTKLLSVIYKDIKFLNDLGFTDYSLLIGIHYVDGYEGKKIQDMKNMAAARSAGNWANGINLNFDHFDSNGDSKQTNGTVIESAADEFDMIKVIQVPQDKLRQRRNTSGTDRKLSVMSARTIAKESQREKLLFDTYTTSGTIDHGMLSADSKQIYYLGIIDTLTEFSLSKSVELNLKTIKYGVKKRKEISSQPPDEYAQRIRTYIDRIIQ